MTLQYFSAETLNLIRVYIDWSHPHTEMHRTKNTQLYAKVIQVYAPNEGMNLNRLVFKHGQTEVCRFSFNYFTFSSFPCMRHGISCWPKTRI